MEQVVPGSIVYSDLKPEAILSDIKLVKYYPTSNVNGQLPQDLIRFELRGNGYFDPFSAYVYVELTIPKLATLASTTTNFTNAQLLDDSIHSLIQRIVIRSEGTELERLENYDVIAKMLNDVTMTNELRQANPHVGFGVTNDTIQITDQDVTANHPPYFLTPGSEHGGVQTVYNDVGVWYSDCATDNRVQNRQGQTVAGELVTYSHDGTNDEGPYGSYGGNSATTLKFAFPLYSGIIGVLMQEKKLIPLSYLPLEIEFTLNPYAFYATGGHASRSYTISKFEIHSHVISFEHDVALQMDAVVARQGLYIPFESFFQCAQTVTSESGSDTQITIPVNAHFKSITSLHMVAIPSGFETNANQKKLQFVSCNAKKLQVRNGINYLPSLPIEGNAGDSHNNGHVPFYMEMLKSYNRLHDHATPVPIKSVQYTFNGYFKYENGITRSFLPKAYFSPRCQYGISFMGEELGKEQSTITGKRGLTPFNIEFQFTKPDVWDWDITGERLQNSDTKATSLYFIPYVRADFLLYVRPDLVVQVMGK